MGRVMVDGVMDRLMLGGVMGRVMDRVMVSGVMGSDRGDGVMDRVMVDGVMVTGSWTGGIMVMGVPLTFGADWTSTWQLMQLVLVAKWMARQSSQARAIRQQGITTRG